MIGTPTPDRLAILRDAERITVTVDCLSVEESLCCRNKLEEARIVLISRAINAGSDIGELVVANVEGILTLIDGFHRYHALLRSSRGMAKAFLLRGDLTREEARWLAFALHWKAEKPLTNSERKEGFKAYVRAGGHVRAKTAKGHRDRYKTYREIGEELGIAHQTLHGWMRSMFPRIADDMGNDAPVAEAPKLCRKEKAKRERMRRMSHYASQIATLGTGDDDLKEHAEELLATAFSRITGKRSREAIIERTDSLYDF
ncbi:MAG: hypothetical protein CMK03_11790 [Ponticaulis sp.]|nr:hypothetical protein [Ponticaulis sp.]